MFISYSYNDRKFEKRLKKVPDIKHSSLFNNLINLIFENKRPLVHLMKPGETRAIRNDYSRKPQFSNTPV